MSKQTLTDRVDQNTTDILHIKNSIDVIKNNHLSHIEKDLADTRASIAKIDNRVWAILIILVGSTVIGGIVQMMGG